MAESFQMPVVQVRLPDAEKAMGKTVFEGVTKGVSTTSSGAWEIVSLQEFESVTNSESLKGKVTETNIASTS
jgi:hypothetical protein